MRSLRREVATLQHDNAALRGQLQAAGLEPSGASRATLPSHAGLLSPLPKAPAKLTRTASLGSAAGAHRALFASSPHGSPTAALRAGRVRRNSLSGTRLEPLEAEAVDVEALPCIDDPQVRCVGCVSAVGELPP